MSYLLDDLIEFEKTARLTEHFLNAVKENNTRRVRIMMKDSLLNDPTFKEYREMRDAAKGIKGLYDKHDGRKYNYDKNTWNDDYLDGKMVQSINHFSPEMNQHLEDVVAHLRPEAHNAAPNPMLRNKPWPYKKMALGVGTAAAIGGGAYLYGRYKKKKRAEAEQEKTAASSDIKSAGLMAAGGLGLTTASLYGSLAMQKRLKKKYGDIDGVNETSILSGIGNDRATNRINPTREQRERAEKFRKSFNRLNFGSRVGMGVGTGLGATGAAMLGDAVSRR